MKKPTLLCILDGFGLNPDKKGNAVAAARKPVFDKLYAECPSQTLITYGERVGLPAGQMGNSEVGHLNIGAGRVVEQWLLRISRELEERRVSSSPSFKTFIANAAEAPKIHFFGLFSDGGVHSHVEHFRLLLEQLRPLLKGTFVLHLITDGRDTSPQKAIEDLVKFRPFLAGLPGCEIGSVCGRFYAMDRDKRWERTERAWDAYVHGAGAKAASAEEWIAQSYQQGTTDEFIEPVVFDAAGVGPKDAAIFWNFREDRMRQLVRALCVEEFDGFQRVRVPFAAERVLCFTEYDHTFHLPFLFSPVDVSNHLGETISKHGLTQLRVAETEKYPHVTYFLNGGIEHPYAGEDRNVVPSPRDVKTYDLKPEMSALGVTEVVVEAIRAGKHDLIVVNLANCDMVGHTGVMSAAVSAVETVDRCLGQMIDALQAAGGQALILADHGNADQMINYVDGTPHTAHTTFPVPVIIVGKEGLGPLRRDAALCDVAPTVLKMMGIAKPEQMTGVPLF